MDKNFMMGLFDKMKKDNPPVMDCYKHMYEKKTIKLISPGDNKTISLVVLRTELFFLIIRTEQTNWKNNS